MQELTWELVELDAEAEPALQQLVKRVRLSCATGGRVARVRVWGLDWCDIAASRVGWHSGARAPAAG